MKLRSQMLLASAMTLIVPWVGWQSVKQLYGTLQQNRIDEQTLAVRTMRIMLSESPALDDLLEPGVNGLSSPHDWYAEAARYPLFIDGYEDDWRNLTGMAYHYQFAGQNPEQNPEPLPPTDIANSVQASPTTFSQSPQIRVRVAEYASHLHLFIQVQDDQVLHHYIPHLDANAGEGELPDRWYQLVNGDSIEVLLETQAGQFEHALFRAMAPGPLHALRASDTVSTAIPGLANRPSESASSASDTAATPLASPVKTPAGTPLHHWQGYWIDNETGYQLEFKTPMPANGSRVGLAIVDVDEKGERRTRWAGSVNPAQMAQWHRGYAPPASPVAQSAITAKFSSTTAPDTPQQPLSVTPPQLFRPSDTAANTLKTHTRNGTRLRLFDAHGRLLADSNKLYTMIKTDQDDEQAGTLEGLLDAVLFRVFSMLVAGDLPLSAHSTDTMINLHLNPQRMTGITVDTPQTSRYVTDEQDRVLGTLIPITNDARGWLLYESNEEHASAYAGSQVARLFSLLLLVSVLTGAGLLVFAIVLSQRIRRLSHEAQQAVIQEGRVRGGGLSGDHAQDEIGELSRQFSSLLSRTADYTHYLEALASRLSHELRTPLSVVRTSLENLDIEQLDTQSRQLIERAGTGADQLSRIIKALVDSTRLEQTVRSAPLQSVRLVPWLEASVETYRQVYPEMYFTLEQQGSTVHSESVEMHVKGGELMLQQALDKLIDNAVGFSVDRKINVQWRIDYHPRGNILVLGVINQGPLIDETQVQALFDPLVSKRSASGADRHLGLGLYMVRLIAEASGGSVFAHNRGERVVFGMAFPV